MPDSPSHDDALLARLRTDRDLYFQLITAEDIDQVLDEEGFSEVSEQFRGYLKAAVERVRGYMTDQIHVLEAKSHQLQGILPAVANSGNGWTIW